MVVRKAPNPGCRDCGGTGVFVPYRHGVNPDDWPRSECGCTFVWCGCGRLVEAGVDWGDTVEGDPLCEKCGTKEEGSDG